MGIWNTRKGKSHKVNIGTAQIVNLQNDGARFCRIRDNPGIKDENNDTYYEAGNSKGGESYRGLRESITVKCEDGDIITGYIIHLVDGFQCQGTDQGDWFIIKPKSNQELIVEDL